MDDSLYLHPSLTSCVPEILNCASLRPTIHQAMAKLNVPYEAQEHLSISGYPPPDFPVLYGHKFLTPCREYLSVKPHILVKKVLKADKRGVTKAILPDPQLGLSIVSLAENKVAHAGGVIELPLRHRSPNLRYYNGDFVVNNLLSLAEGGVM
jgi:hypothetical protein